jgi:hypothetical protein
VPIIPEQDVTPWQNVLRRLLEDQAHFDQLSRSSRKAAQDFTDSIDPGALETYLLSRMRHGPQG